MQQRQVIPQGLVKRVMGPHHHRFVSGVGDGPTGIGAQVDPQGLIAAVDQHEAQAPEQIVQRLRDLCAAFHLRHGQHALHDLLCGASSRQSERAVHHGPKNMLGHLLPVGKSLHIQKGAVLPQRGEAPQHHVVVHVQMEPLLKRLQVFLQIPGKICLHEPYFPFGGLVRLRW